MHCSKNMAELSTEFWGICCSDGKRYSQIVKKRFHVTMAALDPTVVPTSPVVSLMVNHGGREYLLCNLKPSTLMQVNLDLIFDKGENVTFFLNGKGQIHLSGYHILSKDDECSKNVPDMTEEGKGQSVPPKKTISPKKTVSPKKIVDGKVKKPKDSSTEESSSDSTEKTEGLAIVKKAVDGKAKKPKDSDSDDSDEEIEDNKDSKRLESYKRSWSALIADEESDEEESDSDEEDSDSDEDFSKKIVKESNKKKPKIENSKTDLLNSSIGRTPMPQKTPNNVVNSSKTVTPKKVDFVDIDSSDSDNEENSLPSNTTPNKAAEPITPPSSETKKKKKKKNKAASELNNSTNETPAKSKGLASASYSQKLPGGLEYEDIRIGNGPLAKKGRLVHVYYTGMLENSKVFDSRKVGSKPFSFKLGSNQVIKGWDMAVEGMKVGGTRRMKIPPKLGYANTRTGPIPPNSTLYFTVELKAVS